MHDLLTEHYPPDPPIPHPFNNPDTTQSLPLNFRSVTNVDGTEVASFYSYGKELMSISTNDTFTMLLLRCLADKPADRPTLEELQRWITSVEANERNNRPDGFYTAAFGPPEPVTASGSGTTISPVGSSPPGASSGGASSGGSSGGGA